MPLLMSDLDDTLVERPPLFRAWAERFLAEHDADPALVDRLVAEDRGGHRPRDEFLAFVAERTGYDVHPEQFLREFDQALGGRYRLTPGVRAAIVDARVAGWTFAVVTNGPVSSQHLKVRAADLDRLADAVCISEEVGAPKPDPSMFTTAAARAGSTLEGAWMIGDDLDADVAGGQGVGARTVWVRRPDDWLPHRSGARPDRVAADFPDAVRQVLAAAGGASSA
jgi:HAD superfamily hydrolase (TIGR01509 family)